MKKTLQKRNFIVRPYTEMQNSNRYTLFFQERFVTTYVVFSDLLADDNSPGMVNKISFLIEGNDKTIARGNIALTLAYHAPTRCCCKRRTGKERIPTSQFAHRKVLRRTAHTSMSYQIVRISSSNYDGMLLLPILKLVWIPH